ncbi:MAG: hypothetical protein ACFB0B_18950 [Thermonemataceae bacterium]
MALVSFLSCKPTNTHSSPENNSKVENTGKILFLSFKIEKQAEGKSKVVLLDVFSAPGAFKERAHSITSKDTIVVAFLDKQQQPIKTVLVENPLTTSFEDFSPDGTITRQQANLKEAEFIVRANLTEGATYVKINHSNRTDLIKLP